MSEYGPNTDKSGGTRYASGKPALWWAIPLRGLRLVARVTEYGAHKYSALDWAEGQSFSTLFDCLMRHVESMATFGIWTRDPESGQYHAAHAAWNLLTMLHFMALNRYDMDDISPHRGVTAGMTKYDVEMVNGRPALTRQGKLHDYLDVSQ